MIIKHELTMDLAKYNPIAKIHAVQHDRNTRILEISLEENGKAWTIPQNASVLVRYSKSDGTCGEYDSMPNGSSAWQTKGNVLTVSLVPQVLTVSGPVSLSVSLLQANCLLSLFTIIIGVDSAINVQPEESESYFPLRRILCEPKDEDIPKVFFGAALPQTKDDTIMPFRYISKTKDISGYCKTKAQGSSSMNYPKKNQTVKLYGDADCTQELMVNFRGWGPQNKFCFKANWIDLSHARNVVTARLWGDVVKSRANYAEIPELLRTSPNQGAIDGFPVKVYANGIYQGRYTINIPKDAWMANMDDQLDNHCILCGESNADDRSLFRAETTIDGSDWSDEVHDTVPDAIKTRWNEVISFVVNSTDEEFISGISSYFDVDSLIDYYLFGLTTCGLDAFGKNQLYMTYDGEKWYATMYDMDSTWGLWWDGTSFVGTNYARSEYQDFKDGSGNLLYIRLENLFAEEIKQRWEKLKNSALSVSNIINRFEQFTDIAPEALVKEDYASTTANGAFTQIPSQETNNIQQIRSYAAARLAYCESYINQAAMDEAYTIVEYIASDGSQYIDTGISGGENAAYEIRLQVDNAGNWEAFFHGNWQSEVPRMYVHPSGWAVFESNGLQFEPSWNLPDETAHTIRYDSNFKMYKDGSELSIINNTAGTTYPGCGWGSESWKVCENSIMKLYFLKMYTGGVLVRDFVPVKRNADGMYGLYDNVTRTFFPGNGVFTGA